MSESMHAGMRRSTLTAMSSHTGFSAPGLKLLLVFASSTAWLGCQTGSTGLALEFPDGSLEDADAGSDATDAASEEPTAPKCGPQNCGGACCGDLCVPRNCLGCTTGKVFCPIGGSPQASNGSCVSDCSACDGHVTCYTCAPGSSASQASCAAKAMDCPQRLEEGACPCSVGDAGDAGNTALCPDPNQVCKQVFGQFVCITP
jgi:hypothetical protein